MSFYVKDQKEETEVIKEGIPTEEHKCSYVDTPYSHDDQGDKMIITNNRICSICGKVEKVTTTMYKQTYEDVYQQFHGKEVV